MRRCEENGEGRRKAMHVRTKEDNRLATINRIKPVGCSVKIFVGWNWEEGVWKHVKEEYGDLDHVVVDVRDNVGVSGQQ